MLVSKQPWLVDGRYELPCYNLRFHFDRDYFYDADGNEVDINHLTPPEFNSLVVFASVGVDGVLCKHHGEWAFVQYLESKDDRGQYAPVFIRSFTMSADRCIWLKLNWLKTDADLLCDADEPHDIRDYMLHEEWDLPLHSYRGALRIQGKGKVCPYDMTAYQRSFHELKRWSRGRLHEDIGFSSDASELTVQSVDIFDVLEFYHISPYKIWRSRLGRFIWDAYLAPTFFESSEPNFDIAGDLINCKKLKTCDAISANDNKRCCWCWKDGATVSMICARHEVVHAHERCMAHMQLFVDIGSVVRNFRKHKHFSPKYLASLRICLNALVLSQTHKRKRLM